MKKIVWYACSSLKLCDAGLKAHPSFKSSNQQTSLFKGFCKTEMVLSYEGLQHGLSVLERHISLSYSFQADS